MKKEMMVLVLLLFLVGCGTDQPQDISRSPEVREITSLTITSPAFGHGDDIPAKYTCQGDDVNPQLDIEGIPEGTKTLLLIMDDPDAPSGTWDHWIEYNIPPTESIPENAGNIGNQGLNSWGNTGYGGPCPPSGKHRYIFKLYALDSILNLHSPDKASVEEAMEGCVLAKGEFTGKYEKT